MTGAATGVADGAIIAVEALRPWQMPAINDMEPGSITISLVTYWSQGLKVKAYLVKPVVDEGTKLPGLMYARGGIRRVGMVRLPRMAQLARRGYMVMAPVYRGNLGGDGVEDFGGEDRYDLINAVRALCSLPDVADGRVPMIGFSRGAIMALSAALECPEVGAIAVWGGVSDLQLTYEERVDLRRMLRRVVGHPVKQADEYIKRSPQYYVDRIQNPVLIIHGTDDQQVSVKHARLLADALDAAGHVYGMQLYNGLGHTFPKEQDADALDRIFAWFREHNGGV